MDDDHIRIGNPERERAVALLGDALSGGYLDVVEFDERSALAYAAKTRGDLRLVLKDLPMKGMLFPGVSDGSRAQVANSTAVDLPVPEIVEYDVDWDTFRRRGVWHVPSDMLISGSVATVDLDFSNALLPGAVVNIQLQVSASTVKLRLSGSQRVEYGGLARSGWSGIKDTAGEPTRSGGAEIKLFGSVSAGSSVRIKRAG